MAHFKFLTLLYFIFSVRGHCLLVRWYHGVKLPPIYTHATLVTFRPSQKMEVEQFQKIQSIGKEAKSPEILVMLSLKTARVVVM